MAHGNRSCIASWGPAGWTFLHTVSFAYPDRPSPTQRAQMYTFLHSFADVIPCADCRMHFRKLLADLGPSADESEILESRDACSRFLVHAHNSVNARLGRVRYAYDDVRKMYTGGAEPVPIHVYVSMACSVTALVYIALGYRRAEHAS